MLLFFYSSSLLLFHLFLLYFSFLPLFSFLSTWSPHFLSPSLFPFIFFVPSFVLFSSLFSFILHTIFLPLYFSLLLSFISLLHSIFLPSSPLSFSSFPLSRLPSTQLDYSTCVHLRKALDLIKGHSHISIFSRLLCLPSAWSHVVLVPSKSAR